MVRKNESETREARQAVRKDPPPKGGIRKTPISHFLFTFGVCIASWTVLSGHFDALHLSMGVVASLIVAHISSDLPLQSKRINRLPMVWLRFIRYLPWFVFQVFVANVHVLYLACHPKMMTLIDPRVIRFKSRLKSDIALLTLANSITLTPGTISVNISADGELTVHMIDVESGQSLPWIMDARIGEVFGE